jgi:DNA (cytosine-5)-methyltransferase 1
VISSSVASLEVARVPISTAADSYQLSRANMTVVRTSVRGNRTIETALPVTLDLLQIDPHSAFDAAWLRSSKRPANPAGGKEFRLVDLFSGCGAMSLGVEEACRAGGLTPRPIFAVDTNESALAVYKHNFPTAEISTTSVTDLFDGEVGTAETASERSMRERLGPVDMVVGGPPCQGHSDLNNHTRRADPKNRLYLTMARFAEIVRPRGIIIENVPAVVHDRGGVVGRTSTVLERLGYVVRTVVLQAEEFGVAQTRRRFFLVAALHREPLLATMNALKILSPRPLSFAISDLIGVKSRRTFDSSAKHSATNQARMQYLLDHNLHDLPDERRPDCHRLKPHSYVSVYGRMHWDRPAQTITTGFGSTGQGRFVHPSEARTLTPHEAARVQFIPDFFEFPEDRRGALQHMIGNAVPPKLSYAVAHALLGSL